MNKNLFKTFAIAAMAVLAGACAKEQVGSADGETVEMTFNVDVPETAITTKGLSDAAQVDELVFDAFRSLNDKEPIKGLRQVVAVENGRATIQVKLVKGQNYRFVFWAQKANNGYYNTDTLSNITVDYSNALANDSSLDAFFAKEEVTNVQNPISKTIILKRPFAQVNYVTKEELGEGLYITESQITVKNALTSFNPLRNKLSGAKDVTFNYNAVPTEKLLIGGIEYNYLASAFILAKSDNSNDIVDVEAKFKTNNGRSVTVSTPGLPCQRNYRTNVIGNFMSVDGIYNVEIDSAFKGDFQSDYVANALSSGQVVTLTEDYSLPEGSEGVAVPSGKTSILNLNGKRFVNESGTINDKSALIVRGKLTINGEGEVYCEGGTGDNSAIMVDDNGELIINGGTYNVAKDKSGKCNSTIYARGASCKIEINGGVFTNEEGSNGHAFVLNQLDDITVNCFSVKGGTFVGFNPADNESDGPHTNYVAEGYKSVKISESPATWQVVDASKTISDQAGLNSALGEASTGDYLKLPAGTYTLPELTKKSVEGVTFEGKLGADGNPLTVIDLASVAYTPSDNGRPYKDVTFKNISFITWTDNYKGFRHSENLLFEGCTFTGKHFAYGKETYKKCKFIQNVVDYNIWTYGSEEITFNECLFDCQGKAVLIYNEKNQNPTPEHPEITEPFKINFNKCTFTAHAKATSSEGKTYGAIEIDSSISSPFNITITDCTSTGFSYDSAIYHVKKHKYNVSIVIDSNSVYNE